MGTRGPAPKPTALKKLQGNPGKRPLNKREPRPAAAPRTPAAPRWLGEEARREWRRLARVLHPVGLLTEADYDALALYCETFARWREAEEKVRRRGMVIQTAAGNLVQNPYLSIANRAKADALRLLCEFGMTPAARSRVAVDGGQGEPSLADLLFSDMEGGDE